MIAPFVESYRITATNLCLDAYCAIARKKCDLPHKNHCINCPHMRELHKLIMLGGHEALVLALFHEFPVIEVPVVDK